MEYVLKTASALDGGKNNNLSLCDFLKNGSQQILVLKTNKRINRAHWTHLS